MNEEKEPLFIQWQPSFSVGNPIIDRQHQVVISCINDLFTSFKLNNSAEQMEKLCKKLANFTRTHFAYEEKLLKDCGYPELESHLEYHHRMRVRTEIYIQCSKSDDADATREMFNFLKEWWLNHILVHDMEYSAYLKSMIDKQLNS